MTVPCLTRGEMLHHYLCAYVGPSSEFWNGELLRCPKCRRPLSDDGHDWEALPGATFMHSAVAQAKDEM